MANKEKNPAITPRTAAQLTAEEQRLEESRQRKVHWKRWGPYLSERQWGTVREDYSPYGAAWDSFPHDHARSRTGAGVGASHQTGWTGLVAKLIEQSGE